jgi:peptide chain release factor 1
MSHTPTMVPEERLEQIIQRFQYLEAAMAEGASGGDIAVLAKEYSNLRPVVEQISAYRSLLSDLDEAEQMLADPEMKELAEEELPLLKARLPNAEHELQLTLLPKDAADARPAMLEIRPGTGGDEAALFAGDLLRMYLRYCEAHGWKIDILEEQSTELGGIKEVVEIRKRRTPGAAGAKHRKWRTYSYFGGDCGGASRGRRC